MDGHDARARGAPSTRESRSVAAMNPPAAAVVDERGGGWVSLGTPRTELVWRAHLTGQSSGGG